MRYFSIAGILCLLVVCGCGAPEECQVGNDELLGFYRLFGLCSLDMQFDVHQTPEPELHAVLLEMPFTGASGNFVLRDEEGNDYRFQPSCDMDWQTQLTGLQLGKTYRFVFSVYTRQCISGMKVFDGKSLLYLGASYSESTGSYYAFIISGLEGFTATQLHESRCEFTRQEDNGLITHITSLPVVFRYGEQSVKLYQTQEATFTTSQGKYLIHLLHSISSIPQNYDNGGCFYSFYIKRL